MGRGLGTSLFADAPSPPPGSPAGAGVPILASLRERGWVRGLAIAGAVAGGIYAAAATIVPWIDLAPYARPLEVALSSALGRDVIISGGAHLHLFPKLALGMDGLFVANAAGAPSKYFILADHVTAEMEIDVVGARLAVDEIAVDGVNLNLERNPKGEASWALRAITQPLHAGLPVSVIVRPRTIFVTNFRLSHPGGEGAQALMTGRAILLLPRQGSDVLRIFAGTPAGAWSGEARIASFAALAAGAPVQIAAELIGPGTKLNLKGGREAKGASLILTGEGSSTNFSALEQFFGLPGGQAGVGANFTFNLKSEAQGGTLQANFPALGAGDLALAATFKTAQNFEFLGKFTAQHLDLKAFLPNLIGAKSDRLFARAPIGAAFWQAGRIELDLAAARVTLGRAELGAGTAGLFADHGILSAGPIRLSGPDGEFSGDATLDMRATPQLALTFKAVVPSVGALLTALGQPSLDGRLDAAIEISGEGASFADIMAHAAGQTNLLFGHGSIAPQLAKTLPNEIAFGRAAPPVAELDPEDPAATPAPGEGLDVGCLISRFDIEDGRAESRSLLLETAQAITTGEGTVDLAKETFDLHLRPRPRDPALIGEARDLRVSGPIRAPHWTQETGTIRRGLARTAGRVAASEDFAGFMPLLDTAAGLANPCVKTLMGERALASGEAKAPATH